MFESKKEMKDFIGLLFSATKIEINGMEADRDDLISLCERVSKGIDKITGQKQYINAGKIDMICVTTI